MKNKNKLEEKNKAELLFEEIGFWNMECIKISEKRLIEKNGSNIA